MEEIKDSTWSEECIKKLDEFEESRNLVLRATKQVFLDFYRKYFKGDEKVLEIGSGLSFFRRNWPNEFKGLWMELDSQPAFLIESKKKNSNGNYIGGSTYHLPFPDESFDAVCGFCSFDVFIDLEAAIKEAHRVLKKDGLFFHLLDLYPCSKPMEEDTKKRKIPLKTENYETPEGYILTDSISFIPEEKLAAYHRESAKIFDKYPDLEKFMEEDDKIWKKIAHEVNTHDYFEGKLIQTLLSYFPVEKVESGKLSASFKGKRTEQQRNQKGEPFYFFHDSGQFLRRAKYTMNDALYRLLSLNSPMLAKLVEPSSTEISTFKYAIARK